VRWGQVSKAPGRSLGQLFDRAGRTSHLTAVVTASACTDRVVALAQRAPLPVTVDQHTTLSMA